MTPQEKKELEYQRERRNGYGENTAASRRGIRRRKRGIARAGRHSAAQVLGQIHCVGDELNAAAEAQIHQAMVPRWEKVPDEPLGEITLKHLIWDIEDAVLHCSSTVPQLIPGLLRHLAHLGWHPRAVAAIDRSLASTTTRGPLPDLTRPEARQVWKFIHDHLRAHGIEPLARKRRRAVAQVSSSQSMSVLSVVPSRVAAPT